MSVSLSNKKRGLLNNSDLRLIIILLFIILMLLISRILLTQGSSGYALVTKDNKELIRLPLDTDTTYPIEGTNGEYNLLHIENGSAYITDASCPDKICEKKGRISHTGEMIVCLPNKVVVSIVN